MIHRTREMLFSDVDQVHAIEDIAHRAPWSRDVLRDCVLVGYDCRVLEVEYSKQWQLAGYVISRYSDIVCHVLNICIAPDFQGKGLGRSLLQEVIHQPARQETKIVVLEVRPTNKIALQLYEHMGFVQIGVKPGYYRDSDEDCEDALVLQYIRS